MVVVVVVWGVPLSPLLSSSGSSSASSFAGHRPFAYVLCSSLYISHPSSDGEAFACQGTFASPLPALKEREERQDLAREGGRARLKGARAKQKGKMAALPGLMNEANGRPQWSELRSCSPRQSISGEPGRRWQRRRGSPDRAPRAHSKF